VFCLRVGIQGPVVFRDVRTKNKIWVEYIVAVTGGVNDCQIESNRAFGIDTLE
jgi:hypothetical protein